MLSSTPAANPIADTSKVFDQIVRKRGRVCPRCKGRHRDTLFKMCEPCRNLCAAYHKAYRYDHIERKLCTECVAKKDKKRFRKCEHHHQYHNALYVRLYAEKRAKGLCAWGACQEASELTLCETHMAMKRASNAARQNRPRPRNRSWAA